MRNTTFPYSYFRFITKQNENQLMITDEWWVERTYQYKEKLRWSMPPFPS